jgi:hypothetical protein
MPPDEWWDHEVFYSSRAIGVFNFVSPTGDEACLGALQ